MRLILASQSERRASLLRAAGYAFEQAAPPFADPPTPQGFDGTAAAEHAIELARLKAQSLRPAVARDALLLAADTICIGIDGRLIGTPETPEQAETTLRGFVGAAHDVVTGVALVRTRDDRWWFDSDTATVTWGQIGGDALTDYLATGEWRGKAGGYNLFDRQRAGWPIRVDGDAATVVGLPMRKLPRLLERAGFPTPADAGPP